MKKSRPLSEMEYKDKPRNNIPLCTGYTGLERERKINVFIQNAEERIYLYKKYSIYTTIT
jgi:D-mannonate dehydratase